MNDTSNPYASPSDTLITSERTLGVSPTQKKAFRWQILPSLFCFLAIVLCCLLFWVQANLVRNVWTLWDDYACQTAHILSLLTGFSLTFTAAIALAVAARRWLTCRHLTALFCTIAGAGLVVLVLSDRFLLFDFWQDITLNLGWDTDT